MADQGMIVNTATNTNLPKQTMQKRKLARSKSIIKQIFHSKESVRESETTLIAVGA